MDRVAGKIVLITGAARGQGRNHAVRLASEGADIIAFDLCRDIESNRYPLATPADLEETKRLVEEAGSRCVAAQVDVRDRAQVEESLDAAVAELGGLHVVIANAGICPLGDDLPVQGFIDAFDVDFVGVVNTVHAGLRHLAEGASIIVTGSVAGLVPQNGLNGMEALKGTGGHGYGLSKKLVGQYTESLAQTLGPFGIRLNAIHPTNVDTDMLHNEGMYKTFRPDLENPGREDAMETFPFMQLMSTPWVEVDDISHAVVYFASDESRFVTGQQLRVDAGAGMKIGL